MGKKKLNKAQIGTALKPITAENVSDFFSLFSIPQKAITKLITGKYQAPSEAMGIKNKAGAIATDIILDPVNLIGGAGAVKATGAYKNAYKYNPWRFKPNPGAYYRGVGKTGYDDAIESGILRTPKGSSFGDDLYLSDKFSEAEYYADNKLPWTLSDDGRVVDDLVKGKGVDVTRYIAEIPKANVNARRYYINDSQFITNDKVPLDDVRLLKQDWLRGYKEVKPLKKKENGGWLDKYDVPQAQNGIEGTMDGLTDQGFNYNGAWGGTMQMGGNLPGSVGFMYARTQGAAPSNGPYAKKTKASAQNGRAISDNTRLKPIVTEKPINREVVKSTEIESSVMSPQEALLNKLKGVKLKESQDRLNKTAEKLTAIGSLSPNPYISIPSAIGNFTLGATGTATPEDRGLDYMGVFGSLATPDYASGFKKVSRRVPFFKGLSFVDALADIFEFTPSEDLPKRQNGGEMKFYQEGLDFKPKNISQDGSKNPKKKKTLILAEHDPELWDYQDKNYTPKINPFIEEAAGIKKYVNKYFPNEDVEVVPTYRQNIKEALAKSDPNTRLVVMGHSGNKMFGIPTAEFIESVGNTRYENCYAGICYGNDLRGIGRPAADRNIAGVQIPGRYPESYNLQNFNIRSNNEQWVGFAPVNRGGEEGFRDSFFRRSKNPELNKLKDQLKKIWSDQNVEYEKKMKAAEPIESKLDKIYSQNKQTLNLPKAADTKELDYIQYPARTANYGDPLRFDPREFLRKKEEGGEIPQAQLGIGILPTTEQYQKFAENVGEVLSAPQKALTKLISGKYQKPSEAMDIQNKAGAFVTDLILDPVNILAGAKMAKGVDDMIYPTRTYRAQVPGKNVLGYESSDLSKKVYEKGDWTTKDLDEAFQYLKGIDIPGGRPGLITGEDMLLTEYKVPFWKKSVKFDEDVVALKEAQRQSVNPNEYIVPRNRFLYPRKTTSLKAVPEHLKQDKFYSASSIPLSKESYQYRSAPYMYVQDQLDAAVRGKKYKKGGEIKKDDMGYWNPENWGEPVEIDSNQITMEGVYEPLIGVSDTGDVQYMEPGEEYEFDGESVIEYPVANWLDKYN